MGLPTGSTATYGDDDFQHVAVTKLGLGVPAAGHDGTIAFHGHPLARETASLEQIGHGQGDVQTFGLAIEYKTDHGENGGFAVDAGKKS